MNQYRGGQGNDRPHWLSIHSGVLVSKDRVKQDEPLEIPDLHVCLVEGTQPDMLPEFIDDSKTDGGSARLLIGYPKEIEAGDWTEALVLGEDDYLDICWKLWQWQPGMSLSLPQSTEAKSLYYLGLEVAH